jgi:hypothetical protein
MFRVPNQYRIRTGKMGSDDSIGNYGAFSWEKDGVEFFVIASGGTDDYKWEHVSVHVIEDGEDQTPTWEEMCYVRDLFWGDDQCVVQYHPPKSDYVNCHQHTLHLWRPVGMDLPRPPKILV